MNRRLRRKVRVGVHSATEERARITKTAVIVLTALAVVVVLTVIWGNSLRRKAEKSGADDSSTTDMGTSAPALDEGEEHVLPPSTYNAAEVPVLKAEYITLSSILGIDWGERATSLKMNGVSAVSLILYYLDNGKAMLNYSSKTAQAMGDQSQDNKKTNLYEAAGVLDVAGIYTSGCFYINYTTAPTANLLSIYRAYEAALIAEAVAAGFSDVMLLGYDMSEAAAIEASLLMGAVTELERGAVLGIAIPYTTVSGVGAEEIFENFAAVSKFLALDLSKIEDKNLLLAEVNKADAFIEAYNLRMIIPQTLAEITGKLEELGYTNWQIVP